MKEMLIKDFLKMENIEKINFLSGIVERYNEGFNINNEYQYEPFELYIGIQVIGAHDVKYRPFYKNYKYTDWVEIPLISDEIKEVMKNFNVYTDNKDEILQFYYDNEKQFNHFMVMFKLKEFIKEIENIYREYLKKFKEEEIYIV